MVELGFIPQARLSRRRNDSAAVASGGNLVGSFMRLLPRQLNGGSLPAGSFSSETPKRVETEPPGPGGGTQGVP
jgi:hypothetical protein